MRDLLWIGHKFPSPSGPIADLDVAIRACQERLARVAPTISIAVDVEPGIVVSIAPEHLEQVLFGFVLDEIARARRAELIAQLAAEVGADVGAALAIVHARAHALARDLTDPLAVECLDDIREAARTVGSTMRSLTVLGPGAVASVARGSATEAARVLPRLVRRSIPATIASTPGVGSELTIELPRVPVEA